MVRCWRIGNFLREAIGTPLIKKLSFVLPFIVITVDIILIEHAIRINEHYIIGLTTLLFFLSIIEIIVVTSEIRRDYRKTNFERTLTIKLDDFIINKKEKNLKQIIEDFVKNYPEYKKNRKEIYHLSCKIMETHKEEKIEKIIEEELKKYIKNKKNMNVDELLKGFLKKYPKHKKYRSEIYEKICQLKSENKT